MENIDIRTKNPLINELHKFVGNNVKIELNDGKILQGKIKAINYNTGTLVLMTDDDKIIVQSYKLVRRPRDNVDKQQTS